MKLPNGYGSVVKLKGTRRKPYMIKKTVGYNDKGKQIFKIIGYADTKSNALRILADYNNIPFDIDLKNITFAEMYQKWLDRKHKKIDNDDWSVNSLSGYKNAYRKHCTLLHNMNMVDIKTELMQKITDNCGCGFTVKRYIKGLCKQLFDLAIQLDVPVAKNYATFVEIGSDTKSTMHSDFSEEEIEILWKNVDKIEYVDMVLIMIYTSMRPTELMKQLSEKVYIKDKYLIGGSKTKAGINRVMPLHERIIPLIEKRLQENNKYLIAFNSYSEMSYSGFKDKWNTIMLKLKMNHTPYDCRHTFATRMDNVGANKICIKLIMGHQIKDITDGVYTHKTKEQLLEQVNLLK